MAINPEISSRANSLLKAFEISEKIFDESKSDDKQIKVAFQALNDYSKCFIVTALKKDKLTSFEVKSIEGDSKVRSLIILSTNSSSSLFSFASITFNYFGF